MLSNDSIAGNSTTVYKSPNIIPILANFPRSAIGAISEKLKLHNPAAVVKDVITIANPL